MKTDQKLNMTMLCDFYELTMGNGYLKAGFQDRITYFDVYFRSVLFVMNTSLPILADTSENFILHPRKHKSVVNKER